MNISVQCAICFVFQIEQWKEICEVVKVLETFSDRIFSSLFLLKGSIRNLFKLEMNRTFDLPMACT